MIKYAKNIGHKVLVTDMFPNPPAKKYADFFEQIDIKNKTKTCDASIKYNIDAVASNQTDIGIKTVGHIVSRLGLRGIGEKEVLKFTDKDICRKILSRKLPKNIPNFFISKDIESIMEYICDSKKKMIIKPCDSQGSRGVHLVDAGKMTKNLLLSLVKNSIENSIENSVICEDYIYGQQYSVESFVQNKNIHNLAVTKIKFYNQSFIAKELKYLSDIHGNLEKKLYDLNVKIVKLLNLENGMVHTELRVNENGIFLIEIACRGGGGGISTYALPYLTGFYPDHFIVDSALGVHKKYTFDNYRNKLLLIKFFALKAKIKKSTLNRALCSKLKPLQFFYNGKTSKAINDSRDRSGMVVVSGKSISDIYRKKRYFQNLYEL